VARQQDDVLETLREGVGDGETGWEHDEKEIVELTSRVKTEIR
jgi:hypothetical protein